MPQQLIYTSAPRGLVAGRSGYCTVARSSAMREALMLRLEQLSYYQHLSLSGGREHPIFAYRIVDIRGTRFHVLSRIQDAGLDFTGRTNFVAHHLAVTPEETAQLPTPAIILSQWPGWVSNWKREPESLQHEDWSGLKVLATSTCLPARTWAAFTRDAVNGYGLVEAKTGTCFSVDASSEDRVLDLLAESSELLETRDSRRNYRAAAWQYTFTTSLQEQDNLADFRWRLVHANNPAFAKLGGSNCLPLSSVRAASCTEEEAGLARGGWKAPGFVMIEAKQHSISEGGTARFEARADGIPQAVFQWYEIDNGRPIKLEGQNEAVLEVSPRGRAKRYMVRAANSAGHRDSRIMELSIRASTYRPAYEPTEVRPGAIAVVPKYSKSGEAIEQQRNRLMAEQAERAWRRKQSIKRLLLVSLSTIGLIGVVMVMMQSGHKGGGQLTPGSTNSSNAHDPTNTSSAPGGKESANEPKSAPATTPTAGSNPEQSSGSETNSAGSKDTTKDATHKPERAPRGEPQPNLPPGWTSITIGNFAGLTKVDYTNQTYLIHGAGTPLTETNDNFVFVYQKVLGDGEFTATFNGVYPQTTGYRCGIMMRESEEPGARFVFVGISAQGRFWASRSKPDELGKELPKQGSPQKGLRLKREGKRFSVHFEAPTTKEWQWPSSGEIEIPIRTENYLVGLVVSSGNTSTNVLGSFGKAEWMPVKHDAKAGSGKRPGK